MRGIIILAGLALAASSHEALGQRFENPNRVERAECSGFSYSVTGSMTTGEITALPVIRAVTAGTPASVAGVAVNDEVVSFNGTSGWTNASISYPAPGTPVKMVVRRGGEEKTLTLVIGRNVVMPPPDSTGKPVRSCTIVPAIRP